MTRRRRYKQCLFWRGFISKAKKMESEGEMKTFLSSLSEVELIQVEHGWTTWVTVQLKDGATFLGREFWALDSMKLIAMDIYKHAVGEYLDYIKHKH